VRGGRIGACLLLLAALGAPHAAAQDLTLTATAGLDGLGRPGRWAPVHVTVDNRGTDITGALVVEWGRTRLRHAVAVPSPSRRDFELYIRSNDARDVIVVRLESSGRVVGATEVPMRLAGFDERITACIGSSSSAGTESACSVSLSPAALPRSWRGYDAVDRIEVATGALNFAGEPRHAVELWRRVRQIEDAGNTAPASGLVPPARSPADRVGTTLALYLAAISGIGFAAIRRRSRRGVRRYALTAGVVLAGSAAAMAAGRFTPITIRHATVLQQFDGVPGAILQSRAMAEFPANGNFAIRPSLPDTAFDTRRGREDPLEQPFDADGYPLISGRYGLGSTQDFSIEAAGGVRVLDIVREQSSTRVVNVSRYELRDCEFPSGFPERVLGSFPPNAHVETAEPITGSDPIVACRFSGLPLDFSDPSRPVVTNGTTIAVYHLPAADEPR
jgi:hypothetical protein